MTYKEKIQFILNKYPETAFKRSDFFKKYIQEFILGWASPYLTWEDFNNFWAEFPSAERELREQLRGRLPPEQDKNRYLKAQEMRGNYSKL